MKIGFNNIRRFCVSPEFTICILLNINIKILLTCLDIPTTVPVKVDVSHLYYRLTAMRI